MKNHLKVTFSASQYEPLFDLLAEIERMEFFTSADIVVTQKYIIFLIN